MLSHQVTFLTRNTQHAGILSPYFADGILTIDRHTLAFLLLNENSFTPLRRGAQADIAQHRIKNLPPRRQRTAPSGHTPGGPPPPSVTHVVGVCRLAYSKKAPWAPAIRPLLLPANSPHSPPPSPSPPRARCNATSKRRDNGHNCMLPPQICGGTCIGL